MTGSDSAVDDYYDDYATRRLSTHPPEAQFRELSELGYHYACKSFSATQLANRTNADSKVVTVTKSDCVGRTVCCTSTPAERKLDAQKIESVSAEELAKVPPSPSTSRRTVNFLSLSAPLM